MIRTRRPATRFITHQNNRARRGFSLVELGVAVAVIGILAAIAIPVFLGQREAAQDAVAISAVRNVAGATRAEAINPEEGTEIFPGPDSGDLVLAIDEVEPSFQLSASPDLSDGPNHVWVWRMSDKASVYAALSDSGTCWYIYDFLQPVGDHEGGTYLYSDPDPPGTPPECGRQVALADVDEELVLEDAPSGDDNGGEGGEEGGEEEGSGEAVFASCGANCHDGSVWGDPHVVTFDGLGYEFQTVGEWTLLRSASSLTGATPIEAQLRTGNERTEPREVSLATGLAVRFGEAGSEHTVSVAIDDDPDTADAGADALRINGSVVDLSDGDQYALADGTVGGDLSEGYVLRDSNTYYIAWPDPDSGGELLYSAFEVALGTLHMNIKPNLTDAYTAGVEGLLGNADAGSSSGAGDSASGPYDDLMTGTGVDDYLPFPTSNHVLHTDFADVWEVAQADSIFDANGVTYLPRDPGFPDRFVNSTDPVNEFSDFAPADVEDAIEGCETDGVHANLLEACALDVLVFGTDREDEARWGAVNAAVPTLINAHASWDELLTFNDGTQPPGSRGPDQCCPQFQATSMDEWVQLASQSDTPQSSIEDSTYKLYKDRGDANRYKLLTRANVVPTSGDFTLQADVRVPGPDGSGQRTEGYGMRVSDGTTMFQVRFGPTHIRDHHDPDKVFVTNLESRFAQVRIVKTGSTAVLYVDGTEAFTLTPAAAPASPWDFPHAAAGVFNAPSGVGLAYFDNVGYSTAPAHGDLNMTNWAPDPWAHTLHFSDSNFPTSHGWVHSASNFSHVTPSIEDGALAMEANPDRSSLDNDHRHYSLPNTVSSNFTIQAEISAPGSPKWPHTSTDYGMIVSDGTDMYSIRVGPSYISDRNTPAGTPATTYVTDLNNRDAQIRIVKSGGGASLYVDGTKAFDLTAADGSSIGNTVRFGHLANANPRGKVTFDNVRLVGDDVLPSQVAMDNWVPAPWAHSLDFEDGAFPSAHGWAHAASNFSDVVQSIEDGSLAIEANPADSSLDSDYRRYSMPNTVTDTFTLQADISAPASSKWPHTSVNYGMLLSDGTDMYSIRVGPTYIADRNQPAGDPDSMFVTDLNTRVAQVRIVKTGGTAKLYVDGTEALTLTPADGSGWGNTVVLGHLVGSNPRGKATFDNVKFAGSDLSAVAMPGFTPNPWAQLLDFSEGLRPEAYSWAHQKRAFADSTFTAEHGVLKFEQWGNDSRHNRYVLPNTVASGSTLSADVQVTSATMGNERLGLLVADGTDMYWVKIKHDRLEDGNGTATHSIDMTASFRTLRLVHTASGAKLYVDGTETMTLTAVPADTWANSVGLGVLTGHGGQGRAIFDNVGISPTPLTDPVPDAAAPVISLLGPDPQYVSKGDAYVEHGTTTIDDRDGDISDEVVIDASAVDTSTAGSYTVTYNVSDDAGNVADEVTRTVEVRETTSGTLNFTADNGVEAFVNGVSVGSSSNWENGTTASVDLASGDVIGVHATDAGGVAAFIAELDWDGTTYVTDSSWKVSTTAPSGWEQPGFDDSSWSAATEYGQYGVSPWNENVSGFPSGSTAQWIWTSDNDADNVAYFRLVVGP